MRKKELNQEFLKRIDEALSTYKNSISLIDRMLKEKENIQEIILLICARLDSLANLAIKNDANQRRTFINFLSHYSGQRRFFNSVSVGDFYGFMKYYGEKADVVLISKPGRMLSFGEEDDDFLYFIYKSTIPITAKATSQLAYRISKILERNYRVKPNQRLDKKYTASSSELKKIIHKEFKEPKPGSIINAIDHLLDKFKIGNLLYTRYRCDVIHGFKVVLHEEDFFSYDEPLWGEFERFDELSFHIEFPGYFLRNLLEKTLSTFINQIKRQMKISADLFFEIYTLDEVFEYDLWDFLDSDTIKEPEDVRLQLKRR